jgi:mannosidase alpha-like ER degradation enhancer 2
MRLLSLVLILLTGCAARTPAVTGAPPPASVAGPTQAQVRAEIAAAWDAYRRLAWGHDELRPLTRTAHDWYAAPLLMTPVDSLDTLLLAGLEGQAAEARALIVERLSFDRDVSVKTFEITIRLLGGLLSAHQLTGDPRLLALADDLGRRLLPAFQSPTGMPYVNVNLRTGAVSGEVSNPAEVGTLLLEFGTLARLTGKAIYYDRAKRALVALHQRRSKLGLVGDGINVVTGAWTSGESHVGGGIDSYYEYLLKGWLLFGDQDCRRMWQESLAALNAHVADETPGGLWYGVVDMNSGERRGTTFGALHAFLPAVLALGGDLPRARRLQESAYSMWTLAGIEPELLDYRRMTIVHPGYQLRPEIVESAYTLHHLTHDPRYRQMGTTFFADLVRHCRTEDGYTVLKSVVTKEKGDRMHSFLLAETLKYLYLLFSPDEALDLGKVVFNTEAHPLRRIR